MYYYIMIIFLLYYINDQYYLLQINKSNHSLLMVVFKILNIKLNFIQSKNNIINQYYF